MRGAEPSLLSGVTRAHVVSGGPPEIDLESLEELELEEVGEDYLLLDELS
jgi:hypothetical protein